MAGLQRMPGTPAKRKRERDQPIKERAFALAHFFEHVGEAAFLVFVFTRLLTELVQLFARAVFYGRFCGGLRGCIACSLVAESKDVRPAADFVPLHAVERRNRLLPFVEDLELSVRILNALQYAQEAEHALEIPVYSGRGNRAVKADGISQAQFFRPETFAGGKLVVWVAKIKTLERSWIERELDPPPVDLEF